MKIRFEYSLLHLQIGVVCFFFCLFCFFPDARAQELVPAWKGVPGVVLVVDKSQQKLFVYDGEKRGLLREIVCTTGQAKGDKLVEGDLRTPEGVYFIERRIENGLDFELYGGQALVLNFPNPVDKAAQKTGYGIWIHGRGRLIVPRDTRGCVAMDNENLNALRTQSQLGWTPVFIVESLPVVEQARSSEDLSLLVDKTGKWARNWSAKSDAFFAGYNPQASIAGRSFSTFAAQKRNLFRRYAWIHVFLSSVRVVCAGSYAVTYFGQLYQAPGCSLEGIKRLYWQKDKDGNWKIVGEEWRRKDLGLQKVYRQQRRPKLLAWLESWRQAWEKGSLERYGACYLQTAAQGRRKGLQAICEHKKEVWNKAMPTRVEFENIQIRDVPEGVVVSATQIFADATGYQDRGLKELLLLPDGENSWKIVREEWKKQ